jgi:iron complex outermembrane recepter protein
MPLDRTVQDLPHHLRLWLAATVIAAALGASPAGAQEAAAPAAALEEVVVTARKREESLQDAPLSIHAFTAVELEERGVESLADLSKFSPGWNR